MKNELVHPELVRLFVALDQVFDKVDDNEIFNFLANSPYHGEYRNLSNKLGEARFTLLYLIGIDILERSKSNSNQKQ